MSSFEYEQLENVSEKELVPAVVSALFLYSEAQQILEQSSTPPPNDSSITDAKKIEAQEIATSMVNIISTVFFIYDRAGRASDFFSLISSRIEQEPKFQKAFVFGPILLRAIAEGMNESIRGESEKESVLDNIYVATVGKNNVGKGVVTKYLQNKYGFRAYPLSDRVREIASASGFPTPHNRDVLIRVGKKVKEIFNAAVLIRYAITLFSKKDSANMLLFDGLRVEEEALGLKELASDDTRVACISIVTAEEDDLRERYRRALGRGGPKDPKEDTPDEFKKFCQLDAREAVGIEAAMIHADHEIANKSGDLEGTFAQVDEIMREMGIKPIDEQAFDLAKENLPTSITIQYIGSDSGSVRLENKKDRSEFGLENIYAVLIDIDGLPQLVHLLSPDSAEMTKEIFDAVIKMVKEANDSVEIKHVEKLSDFDLIIDHSKSNFEDMG